jgi:hypothetical protein
VKPGPPRYTLNIQYLGSKRWRWRVINALRQTVSSGIEFTRLVAKQKGQAAVAALRVGKNIEGKRVG